MKQFNFKQPEIKEEYNSNCEIFYCLHDKTWRRKTGCKWRAQVKIDNCSLSCKQAIKEGVFNKIKIKRRTIIKRRKL